MKFELWTHKSYDYMDKIRSKNLGELRHPWSSVGWCVSSLQGIAMSSLQMFLVHQAANKQNLGSRITFTIDYLF